MKNLLLICALACGFWHPTQAQITVTNSVFPVVGDTLHYIFGNEPGAINQIFTPPGGSQHWDLSGLQPAQYWNQVMRNPQTGTASGNFASATVMFHPLNSNSEVYWKVTANQVLELGYYGLDPLGLGLNLLFLNQPALEKAWAPVNFFDIHQTASNVLTAFDAPVAPPVLHNLVPTADSFRIRITTQRIASIDAYGSITIPGGTFDVLRKKQTEYRSAAVDVKVAPLGWIDISTIGGQQLLPLGTDTITTFNFLNDVSKEPIAICTLNTGQNLVTGVQYKNVSPVSATHTPDVQEVVGVYPNPVQNTLYVHCTNSARAAFQLRLINNAGATVLEQKRESNATENDVSLQVASLPPGGYTLVMVRNGAVVGEVRVVKN